MKVPLTLTIIIVILLICSLVFGQGFQNGNLVTMVQGGNTATVSTTGAQKVDGSAVTQPVVGPEILCNNSVVINQSSATTTQLIALSGTTRIYVCHVLVNQIGAATAPTFKFVYGTGASCGSGTTNLTGAISGSATAGVPTNTNFGGNGVGYVFSTPAGQALCITTTTTQAQTGVLTYLQQ